jgi:hypothetical protein
LHGIMIGSGTTVSRGKWEILESGHSAIVTI